MFSYPMAWSSLMIFEAGVSLTSSESGLNESPRMPMHLSLGRSLAMVFATVEGLFVLVLMTSLSMAGSYP